MLPYFKERRWKMPWLTGTMDFYCILKTLYKCNRCMCGVVWKNPKVNLDGCLRWFLRTLTMVVVWTLEKGDTKGHYATLSQSKKRHFDNPRMVDNPNFFFLCFLYLFFIFLHLVVVSLLVQFCAVMMDSQTYL